MRSIQINTKNMCIQRNFKNPDSIMIRYPDMIFESDSDFYVYCNINNIDEILCQIPVDEIKNHLKGRE